MTILVVDDDPTSIKLIRFVLERQRHEVAAAASAAAALEWLERSEPPQLLIVDQLLGESTGLELIAQVRADARWSSVPAILCTGLSDVDTVRAASRLGLRHYVVKPIRPAVLLEKVRLALAAP